MTSTNQLEFLFPLEQLNEAQLRQLQNQEALSRSRQSGASLQPAPFAPSPNLSGDNQVDFLMNIEDLPPSQREQLEGPVKREEGVFNIENQFVRQPARVVARSLESILGLPGDLNEFANSVGDFIVNPLREHLLGKGPITNEQKKKLQEEINRIPFTDISLPSLLDVLPTSQELRTGVTQSLTGESLEPQSATERFADEVISLSSSLFIGGGTRIPRALGSALLSQGSKEIADSYGATPTQSEAVKIGTLLGTSLLSPRKMRDFVSSLYKDRDALIKEGTTVESKALSQKLDSLKSRLLKGEGREGVDTGPVIKSIERIESKISDGLIPLEDLVAFKRNINARMGDPDTLKGARNLFKKVGRDIEETIEIYGKNNPKFLKAHKEANEAFAVLSESEKVGGFVGETLKKAKNVLNSDTLIAVEALTGNYKALGGTLLARAAINQGELLFQIMKSPTLRKSYEGIVKQSIARDSVALSKELSKFNKAFTKELESNDSLREMIESLGKNQSSEENNLDPPNILDDFSP